MNLRLLPNSWTSIAAALIVLAVLFSLATIKRRWRNVFHQRHKRGIADKPKQNIGPANRRTSVSTSAVIDYSKMFPPSRKAALDEGFRDTRDKSLDKTVSHYEFTGNGLLESNDSQLGYQLDSECFESSVEFSTDEIRSIGSFPRYDVLTGIRLPVACENFDYTTARPRPYRPFRWGYQQTMALSKMEPDWWLEVENTYVRRIEERKRLYNLYGPKILAYLPGSELACKELMEMCLQFYCARYPSLFSLSSNKCMFRNGILGTTIDLRMSRPLQVLLDNIPEDFAIMMRNKKDGRYYLRAGVLCSAIGWDLSTKIGLPLNEIHAPVPDYKEKMAFSMDRYFSRMATDMPIQRGSWGLEHGTPLYIPPGHPDEKLREQQDSHLAIEDCHLRVDWQTLRRLPLSGGIVFNFKALFTPVTDFREEPYIPSLLLKILKEGKQNILEYKGTWHVEHVVVPELERYEREQYANGLMKASEGSDRWSESTLDETPFFPGWKEKWTINRHV